MLCGLYYAAYLVWNNQGTDVTTSPAQSLEHRAFREAGHAVMSCLIRKGYTDRFVPFDRSLILAPFQPITLESTPTSWNELTGSLGSLITTAQVLSAGYLAERIQSQVADSAFPPQDSAVQTALHLVGAYIEHYGGDSMTITQRDIQALQLFRDLFDYVEERLHSFWTCVDILAKQLLDAKIVSEEAVFATIEQHRPVDRELSRDAAREPEQAARPSKAAVRTRKRWWQFWKY
jgi:hypothetical protein